MGPQTVQGVHYTAEFTPINVTPINYNMSKLIFRILKSVLSALAIQLLVHPAAAAVVSSTNGWKTSDMDPYSTPIGSWGGTAALALDYLNRSIGADLGSIKHFTDIEIIQRDPESRLNSRDLSLFVSNDNVTYQKVAADYIDFDGRIALTVPGGLDARYVKVHCHRTGGTRTCVLDNMQTSFRVLNLTFKEFTGAGGGVWTHRTPIVISNTTANALIDQPTFLSYTNLGAPALIAAGNLNSDYSDLRFADSADRELHASAILTGVYIRIPYIAANSTMTIYAYSGNPSAQNRVNRDVDALQVQYGTRTIQQFSSARGGVKAVQLGGTLLAQTENNITNIQARYSTTGGRTWGASETFLAPSLPGAKSVGAIGSLWDNGKLTFFFYANFGVDFEEDLTDPTYNWLQTYVVQATSFTASGRPIWGTPQRISAINRMTGNEAVYVLSNSNPIKTSSGAYLQRLSYMATPDGTFAMSVFRSTNGGVTWVQSPDEFQSPQTGFERGVTETGYAEVSNGSIKLLARQQIGGKYVFMESTSTNDGVNWTAAADSNVLASNTQPSMFDGQTPNSTMLLWSGHNAFSQTSYYRNNLTAAYSDDNATSWNGYIDLLAGTELSIPGWEPQTFLNVVNNESKPSGSNDRLLAWHAPSVDLLTTMVVEDFEQYIRGSHGATDNPIFLDTARVASGAELADSYWWRTTRTGTLDLVAGQRTGRTAVRIRSGTGTPGYASRLFPGIKDGTVRFAFKLTATGGAGIWISLQEGYSDSAVSRGAALTFFVSPSGAEVRRVTTPNTEIRGDIGHQDEDTTPATGRQIGFGQYSNLGYDYKDRSIGADLYSPRPVTSLVLVDDDSYSSPGDRIVPSSLTVWKSSDNEAWTQVTGWSGSQTGNKITLSGPSFTTRYVKVCQPFSDGAWTFGNRQPSLLEVRPFLGTAPSTTIPLDVPTSFTVGTWNIVHITFDTTASTASVRVNGTVVETCSLLSPVAVVNHLLLGADSIGNTSSASIDELIVIDATQDRPAVQSVGTTVGI